MASLYCGGKMIMLCPITTNMIAKKRSKSKPKTLEFPAFKLKNPIKFQKKIPSIEEGIAKLVFFELSHTKSHQIS